MNIHESSEKPEKAESAKEISETVLEKVRGGEDLQEVVVATAEKLVFDAQDNLENGICALEFLASTVEALWPDSIERLPEGIRNHPLLTECFNKACEVLGGLNEWIKQNPEACEAAARLTLYLLVGFHEPDILLNYLRENPNALDEIFSSLAPLWD